ncbi:MAG: IS1182 family transposase [Acidiferrobacterales bacterium]
MAKTYRDWDLDQVMLLPPSVRDFVPEGHLAHFIRDLVAQELDLSVILGGYTEEKGYPPYHPTMMTALLLYSYCQGIYSSRRISKACIERVDFMAVTALNQPDFRTVSDFRKRHLQALEGLFVQILRLCQTAGLVRLGQVALDGTKVKANASKHKAMSVGRMRIAEEQLTAEVQDWLKAAETLDAEEDRRLPGITGEELPDWVVHKQMRLEKIRLARQALEAEATQARTGPARTDDDPPPPPTRTDGTLKDQAQRNFTDPDSRILKTGDGFVQGYNAQIAVDAGHQIIVAQHLNAHGADAPQLPGMLTRIKVNTGCQAQELSADAGYCCEQNLKTLNRHRIRGYVATGRIHHGSAGPALRSRSPHIQAMHRRLRQGGWRSRYRLRKQVVEPVFGQIKQARGFRQFLLRGLRKVQGEWSLICTAHNLLKLAAATS